MSRVGSQAQRKFAALLRHFLREALDRFVIGNRRAHHEHIAMRRVRMHGVVEFVGGCDVDHARIFRRGQRGWSADQCDFVSSFERRFRNRVTHFSRGTIADETNGIDRLARWSRRDDELHAIKLF